MFNVKCYYNYFIGSDKSKWASFVPLFEEVKMKEEVLKQYLEEIETQS